MKRRTIVVVAWMLLGWPGGIVRAQQPPRTRPASAGPSPAVLLEKAIHNEQTAGDLDAAIQIYRQIVDDARANRPHVAEALYRLGGCLAKKQRHAEALAAFEKLIADYPDQKQLVARARGRLAESRKSMTEAEVAKVVKAAVMTISTMAESDPRVGKALATLEGLSEKATVSQVAGFLKSEKAEVRGSAVYILWKGSFRDISPAVPELVRLCSHEESLTRGMAAIALGARKIDSAFQAIADMTLTDTSGHARRCAAYALGLMGRPDGRGILEKAARDKDDLVQVNAKHALKMLDKAQERGPAGPRVIKTSPPAFADDVDPSLDRISVTFDEEMLDRHWSWVQRYKDKYPQTTGKPSFDESRRTCSLPVKLEPGKVYWIEFNSPPFVGFRSKAGEPARRHALVFAARSAEGKPTPIPQGLIANARRINAAARASARRVRHFVRIVVGTKEMTFEGRKITLAELPEVLAKVSDRPHTVLEVATATDKLTVKQFDQVMAVAAEQVKKLRFEYVSYIGVHPLGSRGTPSQDLSVASRRIGAPTERDRREGEGLAAEGWRLWNRRKLAEAETKFKAAVAKDPTNANAWNGLGWSQFNQGKPLTAKAAFKEAVAIEPKHAAALNGLGWIAKGEGKTDEAVGYWKKAVAAAPGATAALSGLARTSAELGRYAEAVTYYQAWLKVEPDSADARSGLLKAQAAADAVKAAVPGAEQWLKLVDAGKYAESWSAAAGFFRSAVTSKKWQAQMRTFRRPLGKVRSRRVLSAAYATSLPGAPDGQYVVVQFETSFQNKKQAVETITPMKGKDGKWRVSGYYVK